MPKLIKLFIGLASLTLFSACSSQQVSDDVDFAVDKQKFERQFAEQCIDKEIAKSVNKDVDRQRFEKPCLCIAGRMAQDISPVDTEKYLHQGKITQSLRISFEKAAFFCLQNKSQPASLFGRKKQPGY